jgi:cholesterol transport system auxiliary component
MKRASVLVLGLALGGCVSLLPKPDPAPRLFVIEAAHGPVAVTQSLDAIIAVAPPQGDTAALGIDLVWRTGDEIAFVSGVKWVGRAEELLQSLLIETIARDGRLRGAARSSESRADYEIRWELLNFEVVEGAEPKAHFAAHVNLIDSRTRLIAASRIVTSEVALAGRGQADAANALARAAQEGGARIASFAAETVAGAQESAVSINR